MLSGISQQQLAGRGRFFRHCAALPSLKTLLRASIISLFFLLSPSAQANDAVTELCTRIGTKLGSVSIKDCLSMDFKASEGRSVNSAPIVYKEFPPIGNRKPMGRVLLIGGIHGDEYSSVSIVFKWLKTLNVHHSGLFHWRVVPLMNPDGLLRKSSTRVNANGVDLNRNFPTPDWSDKAIQYWIDDAKRNPRRYPGETALSEPETQWLVDEINEFQPDVLVSVHAPHGIVDYDGPQQAPYKLGRLYLNLLGTYPGSLGRYAGVELGMPVVTIELPYAGIMPKRNEISDIWTDLISWLRKNLKEQAAMEAQRQDAEPS